MKISWPTTVSMLGVSFNVGPCFFSFFYFFVSCYPANSNVQFLWMKENQIISVVNYVSRVQVRCL